MRDMVIGMINTLFSILFVSAVLALCVYLVYRTEQRTKECEERGGTYLSYEGRCMPVKSIPLH